MKTVQIELASFSPCRPMEIGSGLSSHRPLSDPGCIFLEVINPSGSKQKRYWPSSMPHHGTSVIENHAYTMETDILFRQKKDSVKQFSAGHYNSTTPLRK